MPIKRLLDGESKFGSDERKILEVAFDRTLRLLHLVDRNDPIVDIVARKVIETGECCGFSDADQIAKQAASELQG
jgi:hypothetical protein